MYWCFHCYALNPEPRGACVRCGEAVEAPADISDDDRLVWTLGHPDGDRAVLAAQSLGRRRARSAMPALRAAVESGRDPYLSVTALRSAIEIAGRDELREWLTELAAHSNWFMVRSVAERELGAPVSDARP